MQSRPSTQRIRHRTYHLFLLHSQQLVKPSRLLVRLDIKRVRFETCLAKHHNRDATIKQTKVTDFLPTNAPRISRTLVNGPQTLFTGNDQMARDVNVSEVHIIDTLPSRD